MALQQRSLAILPGSSSLTFKPLHMKLLIIILAVMASMGCNSNAQQKQDAFNLEASRNASSRQHVKINLPPYISKLNKEAGRYNIFYVFDNTCSICISSIIETINKFKTMKGARFDNTEYFFIAINKDTANIRYYLDKYKIDLAKNQCLVMDKTNEFAKLNPTAVGKEGVNYILTDSIYNTITTGDPFMDFGVRDTYDSLQILNKSSR